MEVFFHKKICSNRFNIFFLNSSVRKGLLDPDKQRDIFGLEKKTDCGIA